METSTFKKVLQGLGGMVLGTLVLMTGPVANAATVFPDVPAGHWAEGYINDLVAKGIINGANPMYRGDDNVQRDEMAQLVYKAAGLDASPVDMSEVGVSIPMFKDVSKTVWSGPAIYRMVKGINSVPVVNGYTNQLGQPTGYFGPGDKVTRGQAAKIIKLGFGIGTDLSCATSFADVNPAMWEYEHAETLYARKVVDGNTVNGVLMYRPNDNATRYEMSKIVSNAMNLGNRQCGEAAFGIEGISPISNTDVLVCFNQPIDEKSASNPMNYILTDTKGDQWEVLVDTAVSTDMCVTLVAGALNPGEMYNIEINNVKSKNGEVLNAAKDTFKAFQPVVDQADLSCFTDTQPVAANVEQGATGVDFLSITCTGPQSGSVIIDSLTPTHYGSGDDADISKVSLFANGVKLADDASADITKFENLAYEVAAAETVNFVFKVDVSANAIVGKDHGYKIMQASDIGSNAAFFAGTFPITGNLMKIVTPDQNNGGANNNSPGSIDVVAGSGSEVELARFVFTSDLEDVAMKSVTFGVLDQSDGATIDYARLYTGNQCQTPVSAVGGGSLTVSPDINGLLKFTGVDLTISEIGETPLCVKAVIQSVTSGGPS